jgi:hypothetical protein
MTYQIKVKGDTGREIILAEVIADSEQIARELYAFSHPEIHEFRAEEVHEN